MFIKRILTGFVGLSKPVRSTLYISLTTLN